MGWGGAGGNGAATVGLYYFFGGMLQIIGSILEWFIGNTFPFVVFGSFGMLHCDALRFVLTTTCQVHFGSPWQRR
jgi:succinate-acetate transporter protein